MIIFQHTLQNLFQVADLKEEGKKKEVYETRLLMGIWSCLAVSQLP